MADERTTKVDAAAVRSRALQATWACLVVGIGLMLLSLGTVFLYGPLFFAAFVLSIVAMAQGRVAAGIIALLVTVAVPSGLWLGLVALRVGDAMNLQKEEKQTALASVEFEEIEGYIDGGYMYLKGKVRNNGDRPVDYVKVGVEWLDKNGTVLDTDSTYAVSGESLRAGAAKSFSIMTPADSRMAKFRHFVVND